MPSLLWGVSGIANRPTFVVNQMFEDCPFCVPEKTSIPCGVPPKAKGGPYHDARAASEASEAGEVQ